MAHVEDHQPRVFDPLLKVPTVFHRQTGVVETMEDQGWGDDLLKQVHPRRGGQNRRGVVKGRRNIPAPLPGFSDQREHGFFPKREAPPVGNPPTLQDDGFFLLHRLGRGFRQDLQVREETLRGWRQEAPLPLTSRRRGHVGAVIGGR